MKSYDLITHSAEETAALGTRLGSWLERGDVLALAGELGSGKTVFVQGLARGLQVPAENLVTSPSFVLLHEYPGRLPLYHFDFYRLQSEEEVRGLGYEEYFDSDGVCAVEWADKFAGLFGLSSLWIYFLWVDEFSRELHFQPGSGLGQRSEELFQLLASWRGEKNRQG